MPSSIEDYALIGDCQTAALVGRDGSIDWLCWPRFDAAACFAALLGSPGNGRWRIAPEDPSPRVSRRYRDGTLILETELETAGGWITVIDFMALRGGVSDLVRLVVGRRGRVRIRSELVIRFDYGAVVPWVTRLEDGTGIQAVAGPAMVVLRTTAPLHGENLSTVAELSVEAGDTVPFVLSYSPSHVAPPATLDPEAALAETEAFWQNWSSRCRHTGPWHEAVLRSHITLKALTYAPTGGIVAAPTTSLPERIGGVRNWDYRYCWLRDATFTLMSLMDGGYFDEAKAWSDWLLRAVAGRPSEIQIMYGLAGERRLAEWEMPWLTGYHGSRPVRVGNAAHGQLQLDVYGEVMDALYQARRGGLVMREASWALQRAIVEHLETIWQEPDEGIWEVRGERRHFTHSKVMAWVAFDRAIRSIEEFGLRGPLDRWRAVRQQIHEDVCRNGYDRDLGSFVQSYGARHLDASLLMLALVGFLPPSDPRIRGTVSAIEERLLVEDTFVLRYDTEEVSDGLPPGEGAFLACSFWLADNLILLDRHEEAGRLFERLLALRNDVGLLAEEYDPVAHRQLGNFPQAFSHIALATTARNLTQAAKPAQARAATAAT
jgi:GH15 family glucan-1,4-alpha-glucosidase